MKCNSKMPKNVTRNTRFMCDKQKLMGQKILTSNQIPERKLKKKTSNKNKCQTDKLRCKCYGKHFY